jgi:hypothetical protein
MLDAVNKSLFTLRIDWYGDRATKEAAKKGSYPLGAIFAPKQNSRTFVDAARL